MNWKYKLCAAALCVSVVFMPGTSEPTPLEAQEAGTTESAKAAEQIGFPQMPADLKKRVFSHLESWSLYQQAKKFEKQKIEAQLPYWSQQAGYKLEADYANFLSVMLDADWELNPGGDVQYFQIQFADPNEEDDIEDYQLVLMVDDDESKRYALSESDLSQFSFEYMESVTLIHPLNKKLPRYVANDLPLPNIASGLCENAGVEHVIRRTSDDAKASVLLTNRTVIECLKLIVSSANWTMQVDGETRDRQVDFWEISGFYSERRYYNIVENANPRIETLFDAASTLINQNATAMTSKRPVVIIGGPNPATQAAGEAPKKG